VASRGGAPRGDETRGQDGSRLEPRAERTRGEDVVLVSRFFFFLYHPGAAVIIRCAVCEQVTHHFPDQAYMCVSAWQDGVFSS
jgi:LSD1 subclass zinc finger protein